MRRVLDEPFTRQHQTYCGNTDQTFTFFLYQNTRLIFDAMSKIDTSQSTDRSAQLQISKWFAVMQGR